MRLLLNPTLRDLSGLNTSIWPCCMIEFSDKKIIVNKSDTVWNWAFNMPCKSLKGIPVLFEDEKAFTRDTSKFYYPKIQKASVIVEGKPNQLYAQGMRSFDEACKYFTEERPANDAQAQLQPYDVSLGEYLVNKYALRLDFRTIDENELHGMGRRIENTSEGTTLQIEKIKNQLGISMLTFKHPVWHICFYYISE